MKEIIKVENLTKQYSGFKGAKAVTALDNINLTVQEREFIGVMGPSGSGKTTLLNVLSGVDSSTSGKILIEGRDIAKIKGDDLALFRRRKTGYIFQDFNLLDSLTIKENIALPLILDKVSPHESEARTQELLNFFRIADIADKYPYFVSGGQKQRSAAARALILSPAVVFADEPTGNLDSKSSADIMQMLYGMNTERGTTILMVTHDAFAASWCKRIIFIKDGKIHTEIQNPGNRREFFDKIMETLLVVVGGEVA